MHSLPNRVVAAAVRVARGDVQFLACVAQKGGAVSPGSARGLTHVVSIVAVRFMCWVLDVHGAMCTEPAGQALSHFRPGQAGARLHGMRQVPSPCPGSQTRGSLPLVRK